MSNLTRIIKIVGIGLLGLIVFSVVFILSVGAGTSLGSLEVVSKLSGLTLTVAALFLVIVGYMVYCISKGIDLKGFRKATDEVRSDYRKQNDALSTAYQKEADPIKEEARELHRRIEASSISSAEKMKQVLKLENGNLGKSFYSIQTRYANQAAEINSAYTKQERALCDEWNAKIPSSVNVMQWGVRIIAILMMVLLGIVLIFSLGATEYSKTASDLEEGWNATTISLPHLTDGARYVSNPDSVLTAETEAAVNRTMKLMDKELGIESAVIAVRHVENGDVFRIAQDLFDMYGIGKDDRGLVIVLAVDDRKARVHTGYALEADFTDLETQRLQDTYLVPFMKRNMPNEGLRALTDACYSYLSHKEMPVVHVPSSPVLSQAKAVERKMLPVFIGFIIWGLILWAIWNYASNKRYEIRLGDKMDGPWDYDTLLYTRTPRASRAYDSDNHKDRDDDDRNYSSSSNSYSRHDSGGYSGGGSGGGGSTSSW